MVWPDTVTFDIELTDDYSNYEISNDKLIKESVKFDERMCTGDRLKFGLCEGSVIEFQYFDYQNIRGKRIFVKVEVEIKGWVDVFDYIWYPEYIIIEDGDYKIVVKDAVGTVTITHDGTSVTKNFSSDTTIPLSDYRVGDKLEFSATISGQGYIKVFEDKSTWEEIPIGWFDVEECPRQASTGIYKATAYNKLKSDYLNNKANTIVEERFGNAIPVSVYDIKRLLLDGYSIFPVLPPIQAEDPIEGISTHEYSYKEDFHLLWLGGVNTLFSGRTLYEELGYLPTHSAVGYIELTSMPYIYDLGDGGHYSFQLLDKFKLSIKQLEKEYYQFLEKLFGDAKFSHTEPSGYERPATGQECIDEILGKHHDAEYWSWGGYMYIAAETVRTQSGVTIYEWEYYSTMRKEIEERGSITPSTCSGTIDDFFDRVFQKLSSDNYTGRIKISMPDYLIYTFGTAVGKWMKLGLNTCEGERIKYRYFNQFNPTDMNDYSSDIVKEFVLSDGNVYTAENYGVYKLDDVINPIEFTKISLLDAQDFTLRDIIASSFETQCQYGKLDRETDLFSGVELNNSRLLPADTLYPANDLYPNGMSEHPMKSQYSKLWTDSAGVQKFRYLIITYKTLEGEQGQEQEVEKTLQRTVNNDGNVDYNMSDNWLFRNLVWTDEQVGEYADAMVLKMKDVTWFPFEMWCAGLPYLEAGDEIEITTDDGTYTSYVLNRQLNGIHNLEDNLINGTLDIF